MSLDHRHQLFCSHSYCTGNLIQKSIYLRRHVYRIPNFQSSFHVSFCLLLSALFWVPTHSRFKRRYLQAVVLSGKYCRKFFHVIHALSNTYTYRNGSNNPQYGPVLDCLARPSLQQRKHLFGWNLGHDNLLRLHRGNDALNNFYWSNSYTWRGRSLTCQWAKCESRGCDHYLRGFLDESWYRYPFSKTPGHALEHYFILERVFRIYNPVSMLDSLHLIHRGQNTRLFQQ